MYDIAIIGGGINGCGIARDAAGRGLSVLLAEKDDLASGTSSASTKLIHGGLRYLEHYEFRLVRESLREREVLLAHGAAHHPAAALRAAASSRAAAGACSSGSACSSTTTWAGASCCRPRKRHRSHARRRPASRCKPEFTRGFEYSDCWVDDARLVVLNAMDAAARGADIRVRTEVDVGATGATDHWQIDLRDAVSGEQRDGGGARARQRRRRLGGRGHRRSRIESHARPSVRLVKGSHIVVPQAVRPRQRLHLPERRPPHRLRHSLRARLHADRHHRRRFRRRPRARSRSPTRRSTICAGRRTTISPPPSRRPTSCGAMPGVRSLHDDGEASAQDATRDFVLELDGERGEPPLLSIFGGKITTYRQLAEEALQELAAAVSAMRGPPWTRGAPLPGGDLPRGRRDAAGARAGEQPCPALGAATAERLARTYGTMARDMLAGAHARGRSRACISAPASTSARCAHLVDNEWAMTADDILWRRTKLGLRLTQGGAQPPRRLARRASAAASPAAARG